MTAPTAICVNDLRHQYGDRQALAGLSFEVDVGEIFGILGPNGGGKTTLFRVLSTLIAPQQGEVSVLGMSLPTETAGVRSAIGVVFQSPSLDPQLTVLENLSHQAALYGLPRSVYQPRATALLSRLGLSARGGEFTRTLSGGLRRRVELAKGMIHQPRLLLMDEPSTGLDPGARNDFWQYLGELREEMGVTIVLTTHLLEEAEKADRIAIMNAGKLVALDAPEALRAELGGDTIILETKNGEELASRIQTQFGVETRVLDGMVRLELAEGSKWVPRLMESFATDVTSIRLGRPTLEDVFIARTGHRFWSGVETAGDAVAAKVKSKQRGMHD